MFLSIQENEAMRLIDVEAFVQLVFLFPVANSEECAVCFACFGAL